MALNHEPNDLPEFLVDLNHEPESIDDYIRERLDTTSYSMAKLLKKIYGYNYRFSKCWYFYDEKKNIWVKLNQYECLQMREKMITEVADHIADVKHKSSMKACDERISKSDRDVLVGEVKRFYKIQKNLFTKSFIDNTMKMAESEFFDEDFTNKLNKDPLLFACRNGVLELRVKTDSFTLFQKQRVREEAGTETTFKMIYRSYKKWHGTSDGRLRALNSSDLLKRINEEWGEPVEGIYFNKRVFCDEEDVDEFDGVIA